MTRALPFTQAAVERAIKAVQKQGLKVTGITVGRDGYTVHIEEDLQQLDATIDAARAERVDQ
jgi:biotin operon repressor